MRLIRLSALSMALTMLVAPASWAAVIYQHTFDGLGVALNGTAVDVGGQNWESGAVYLDDGVVNPLPAAATGQAAWLPFTPSAGKIYTLSARIRNDSPEWIAVGFLPLVPNGAANWTLQGAGLRHSNNNSHAWILTRNLAAQSDQQAFNGTGTSNPVAAINGDLVNPVNPIDVKIRLNTLNATWTAEYFLNGTSYGVNNLIAAASTNIRGVGFSRTGTAAATVGGLLQTFELTEVPEPSAVAMVVLGLLSVAGLGRRR